ncbi:hypothetical protein [Parafrankia discariae]|uniref:hypothetical protein n=1 Tax=Parafrankia discariae TaxID=365528 RepID=UPI000360191F|nr:hypothetical protein [Parafrankia discariae]
MDRPPAAAARIRLFVLLTWTADLGLPLTAVGVLGVEEPSGAWRVSWLPQIGTDQGRPWRDRLAGRTAAPDGALLAVWAASSTCTLDELAPLAPPPDLSTAVEAAVDDLLVPWDPQPVRSRRGRGDPDG